MPFVKKNQITMEKSPYYLTSKPAASRIFKVNPKMKFIIMVREPVKRAVSQFTHDLEKIKRKYFRKKKYSNVDKYLSELIFHPNETVKRPAHYIVAHGMYSLHFKEWLKYFPKEQFLIVNGENFIKNPYEEVKKAEKFLNLKPYIQKDHFIYDKKKGFFCMNKKQQKNKTECMGLDKGRKHPNISESILRKLNEFYKPYSKEFFKLINQNPFWKI
jgi:hypothetical protein